jgi:putative transport protein
MDWPKTIFADPTAIESTLAIFAIVIALGLSLGSISFRGVRLGVAGILFVGLAFGHLGLTPSATVLSFAREFGLVLFVFAVGLSVGPGFFNAFKSHGLTLNLLAAGVVLLGVIITSFWIMLAGISGPVAVGLFCGATTNTPSLAASGQALRDFPPSVSSARQALVQAVPEHPLTRSNGPLSDLERDQLINEVAKLPAMAYAVSYPGGIFGIIAAILLLRWLFRADPIAEAKALEEQHRLETPLLTNLHVRVTNVNLWGLPITNIPAIESLGIVISRVMRGSDESVATESVCLCSGDILMVVGQPDKLKQFVQIVGEEVAVDASTIHSDIQVQWITVSRKDIAERTVADLMLSERFAIQLTRIRRAGVELPPMRSMRFHLGDKIRVVGLPDGIAKVAAELGDSPRQLSEPELLPIFLGILVGVLLGSIPFRVPGVPAAVKLGLAGGPLLVAIMLSRLQRIGPIVWYLPRSANLTIKDVGIALFLSSVGLMSGNLFVDAFADGSGPLWFVAGAAITLVPLLLIGVLAHFVSRENYLTIIGLLAGSMTDPPALAFANGLAKSEIPSVSYATVYPLTMILRILAAQIMMMYWAA